MINKCNRLSDFLIVGSMKAGTTSLRHWLVQSKSIAMQPYEIGFFTNDSWYYKGSNKYSDLLPDAFSDQIIGDDTPTYSFLDHVPYRIYKIIPSVKILWILRDPLERAISHYWNNCRKGFETRDINTAFLDQLNGVKENIWQKKYLLRSCYYEQIDRYLKYFYKDQVHFIDFRRFINEDLEELKDITNFLGIDFINKSVPHANKTYFYPRSYVNLLLSKTIFSKKKKYKIRFYTGYRKQNIPVLSEYIKDELIDYFNCKNKGIFSLTGISFQNSDNNRNT